MISELMALLLVCVSHVCKKIEDLMKLIMTRDHRPAAVLALWISALLIAFGAPAWADSDEEQADDHVLAAEEALQDSDYWMASAEYRKAAELSDDPEIAKRATRIAYTYKFNKDALATARRWVKLDESSDEALLYLALIELRNENIRKSRNAFRDLLENADEEPADERLISLIPFLSEEDPDNADKLMRQLAKPYDKSPYANYAVAVLAFYNGDSETALESAKFAAEKKPEWIEPHLLYARALLLSGDKEGAIDYTARLVGDAEDPEPAARLELAIMYLSAGREDDALSQVNQVLLEQPSRMDALRLLAIINFRLENYDAAWQDFEDLLASGRYTMDAFFYLARIADIREEYDRAIALYSEVKSGDNVVQSQRRVAGILAQQEKYDEAERHLGQFAADNPSHAVDMMQAQAQLLASQERYEEALDRYDEVIRYRPRNENALLSKGELLLRMERLEEAIAVYREAVELFPESAISLNALGYTLADRTDRYKEAHKLIKKALKIDPNSAAIIDSWGWVLYRQGDYEQALAELERAYTDFQDPEVAAHIIEVLWKMERHSEAIDRLADAEELWPEDELLERVRVMIEAESED